DRLERIAAIGARPAREEAAEICYLDVLDPSGPVRVGRTGERGAQGISIGHREEEAEGAAERAGHLLRHRDVSAQLGLNADVARVTAEPRALERRLEDDSRVLV